MTKESRPTPKPVERSTMDRKPCCKVTSPTPCSDQQWKLGGRETWSSSSSSSSSSQPSWEISTENVLAPIWKLKWRNCGGNKLKHQTWQKSELFTPHDKRLENEIEKWKWSWKLLPENLYYQHWKLATKINWKEYWNNLELLLLLLFYYLHSTVDLPKINWKKDWNNWNYYYYYYFIIFTQQWI